MSSNSPLRDLGDQLGRFIGDPAAREDLRRSLETVAQGAFARLDLVTREQFDMQVELLAKARIRIGQLEDELARLQQRLDELERDRN